MVRWLRILILAGIISLLGATQAVTAATIPYDPPLFRDVEEAARALQAALTSLRVIEMLPSDTGGYDPVAVPLEAFVLGPKTLTLKYKVPRVKESTGFIHTRPVPLQFSTRTPEEVEKTKTFPLEIIMVTKGIMSPDPKNPTWRFFVTIPGQGGAPDLTLVGAITQPQAEVLYRAVLSFMAAAGNPAIPKEKVPATLSFARLPAPAPPERAGAPKLGFSVLPAAPPGKKGLPLTQVEPGSLADKAGLKAGDELLAVNGTEVASAQEVAAALKPQENILTLSREGKTIKIKLATPVSF